MTHLRDCTFMTACLTSTVVPDKLALVIVTCVEPKLELAMFFDSRRSLGRLDHAIRGACTTALGRSLGRNIIIVTGPESDIMSNSDQLTFRQCFKTIFESRGKSSGRAYCRFISNKIPCCVRDHDTLHAEIPDDHPYAKNLHRGLNFLNNDGNPTPNIIDLAQCSNEPGCSCFLVRAAIRAECGWVMVRVVPRPSPPLMPSDGDFLQRYSHCTSNLHGTIVESVASMFRVSDMLDDAVSAFRSDPYWRPVILTGLGGASIDRIAFRAAATSILLKITDANLFTIIESGAPLRHVATLLTPVIITGSANDCRACVLTLALLVAVRKWIDSAPPSVRVWSDYIHKSFAWEEISEGLSNEGDTPSNPRA